MARLLDMKNKKRALLLYILLTISLAIILWGLGFWESKNIAYGFIIILSQIALIEIIFKHRESEISFVNYLFVTPTALVMILIINNLITPLTISVLISLLMLIPIHFLEKYIRYSLVQE